MIAREEEDITTPLTLLVHRPNRRICMRTPLYRRLIHARMPHHIRRRKVIHQEPKLPTPYPLHQPLAHGLRAHLRIEVVRRDPWGGYQIPLLAVKLLLNAAIEEERHMCILLSLGDVVLRDGLRGQPLGEDVAHVLRREGDGVGELHIVLRHSCEVDILGEREVGER